MMQDAANTSEHGSKPQTMKYFIDLGYQRLEKFLVSDLQMCEVWPGGWFFTFTWVYKKAEAVPIFFVSL